MVPMVNYAKDETGLASSPRACTFARTFCCSPLKALFSLVLSLAEAAGAGILRHSSSVFPLASTFTSLFIASTTMDLLEVTSKSTQPIQKKKT